MSKHYVVVENGLVIDGFSDDFRKSDGSEIELEGIRGRHFTTILTDENGNPRYKEIDRKMVERTEDERDPIVELKKRIQDRVFRQGIRVMEKTDWKVDRHREEKDLGISTTLSDEEYEVLLNQRKIVRDKIKQFYQQIGSLTSRKNIEAFIADFGG